MKACYAFCNFETDNTQQIMRTRRRLTMEQAKRPETMERITTPELAKAFIDEQIALDSSAAAA